MRLPKFIADAIEHSVLSTHSYSLGDIMKKQFVLQCMALIFQFWAGPTFATVLASSTFDANAEGWQLENDATTAPNPIYSSSGGLPGGAIEGIDVQTGGVWRFVAPATYLGNDSAAYGGLLSYDLLFTLDGGVTLNPFAGSYVFIRNAAINLTLGYDASSYPVLGVWNHFVIPLTAPGWTVGGNGGPAATEAQMQAVLSDLTSLRVRGEFNTGPDLAFLDNVVLSAASAAPEPATLALIGLGLAGLGFSRRKQ
jgi:hypothetical protein